MPKRNDIKKILIIGSGPIVIGQACEFDYSGTQALKALKEEGYEVVLVNSNPATIMTDPEFANRTYIEPLSVDFLSKILERERPDAVLPTMGGQTALNLTLELHEQGVLDKYNCELIGANVDAIQLAEDRQLFREAMDEIGLSSAKSALAKSLEEGEKIVEEIGLPVILRPSRTLGGTGGGIILEAEEIRPMLRHALQASPNHEVLIEQSLIGWKEMELEVMRDHKDNVVIVCGIENLDPMGVHTGDSITVAPIQTLTDKEYQLLRDAAIKIMRRVGVDTGGSNVQFALNPENGELVVIEMNPRVSRSSALASKATGFPIAKIAAKLAVGYTLDEIPNDITKKTPACFEPSIDYVVVKIPRFNFEKFPAADTRLGTQMKSVGETMAFGSTFQEALQKAMSSLELDSYGFDYLQTTLDIPESELLRKLSIPTPRRLWLVGDAFRRGISLDEIFQSTKIDHWFLREIEEIIDIEKALSGQSLANLDKDKILDLKMRGYSDKRISALLDCTEADFRQKRQSLGVRPSFRSVDTCAAEFPAETPYLYSSYSDQQSNISKSHFADSDKTPVIILGSGPNRIGQGIEFDYCCVHAVMAYQEQGYQAIMINCNPETVSTDYDISDGLFFEPITEEHVLEIIDYVKPEGIIVQFGGQTPLKLAAPLNSMGVKILGTSVDSIDVAEDRERFSSLISELHLKQPEFGLAKSIGEALQESLKIGYPLMIRPSFVLGGRAMRVLHNEFELRQYMHEGVEVSHARPVLLDRYLHNAIEVDVDAVSDGEQAVVAGVMEHIERAGIHSGDSSCCLPPQSLSPRLIDELKLQAKKLALALNVKGLLNVQFAVSKQSEIFVLEANPRASRTIPFVSKATGLPWAKIAAKVMSGVKLAELIPGYTEHSPTYCAIKASVFPFNKFPGVDSILGPEMKSTGEVMGIADNFENAFLKAMASANVKLPHSGRVFLSVMDKDKSELELVAKQLIQMGFKLVATTGTANFLAEKKIEVEKVKKVREGSPHVLDLLNAGDVSIVINTPEGSGPLLDSKSIRLVANELSIPTFTTMAAADALTRTLKIQLSGNEPGVCSLQEYHSTGGSQ